VDREEPVGYFLKIPEYDNQPSSALHGVNLRALGQNALADRSAIPAETRGLFVSKGGMALPIPFWKRVGIRDLA